MRGLPLLAIIFLLIGFYSYQKSEFNNYPQIKADSISIESDKSYFEYQLVSSALDIALHVVDLSPAHRSMKDAGFSHTGAFLTDDTIDGFKAVKARGACPASYLNKNVQAYLFIPENQLVRNALEKATGRDTNKILWVRGHQVKFTAAEIDGHSLKDFRFGRGNPFLVKEVEIY